MACVDDMIEGLQILRRYNKDGTLPYAEHDILMYGDVDIVLQEEDGTRLDRLGWFKSEEYECWAIFT